MFQKEAKLSRSLEDYLEAILNLSSQGASARVKDIAQNMSVTMPSVNGAVRNLASKGLVDYKPYESIALTPEGEEKARGIAERHTTVKQFLVEVLGVNPEDAEAEACGIEHAIEEKTLEKLVAFVNGYPSQQIVQPEPLECCRQCVLETDTVTTLDQLCPGKTGTVLRLTGKGGYRKRLMEMGLSSGTDFQVLRIAPLGDPVEVRVRGYLLSLRKSEASQIKVRITDDAGQVGSKS